MYNLPFHCKMLVRGCYRKSGSHKIANTSKLRYTSFKKTLLKNVLLINVIVLSANHCTYDTLQTEAETNLSLKPLQCELFLHLVLDPGICTVLPFQQGRPAVTCLSICLHQNYSNQTIVLY